MTARILVVEDHPPSLELVRYLLQSAGYAVSGAGDGLAGLEQARRVRPDLVVCDIQMPGMDGYALLAALRADAALAAIPVIAVTAFSMPGDRHRILEAGFEGYISKPIVPETFIAQVGAFLPPHLRAGGDERR